MIWYLSLLEISKSSGKVIWIEVGLPGGLDMIYVEQAGTMEWDAYVRDTGVVEQIAMAIRILDASIHA